MNIKIEIYLSFGYMSYDSQWDREKIAEKRTTKEY